MKPQTKARFGHRWFIGSVAIASAAGPVAGAVYLSRRMATHDPGNSWLSFVVWALAVASLIFWPAYVPALLRSILQTDAGLEELQADKEPKSVVTDEST
jgi:hypothetical protein